MGEWDPPRKPMREEFPMFTKVLASIFVIAVSAAIVLAGAALVIWAL